MVDKFVMKNRYRFKSESKTIYEVVFADHTGAAMKYKNSAGTECGIFIEHRSGYNWEEVKERIQYWITNGQSVFCYDSYAEAYKVFCAGDIAIIRATFFGNEVISMEVAHS